jgi:hypothetical protein
MLLLVLTAALMRIISCAIAAAPNDIIDGISVLLTKQRKAFA